ncbi:hypothetical protein HRR83_000589 [Exophiala dermatitidis]|uniref:Uncharacterized protein n=1 Tax=Exophiala dermatitidis TaxID=5970 RepID=A0AAN6F1N7_EXODE|nr:hypothetical protein HRR74_000591 [Exophiala dermatitidis]KAJ4528471.1 hypothetical protein HRR73_001094 [Exophiala dermatitidis]KAJ4531434.1 hypothetical protein HRR76_009089 [Exophiala dermatitidis]KAJ4558596.1 hypothetical protein HRR77_000589 [Exophiala dermatitidis]KAJ4581370.1 hypothetical protein HRR79_000407 [Exophiala dermatitidis]
MDEGSSTYPSLPKYSYVELPSPIIDPSSLDAVAAFNNSNDQQQQQYGQALTPYAPVSQEQPPPSNAFGRFREGLRQGRSHQPKVYNELPSFPLFEEPIPDSATLEEICVKYPNHLRGEYLDAFIQWRWTANDIYSLLTPQAIQEFREQRIATCKTFNNRANFLFKRLDARLRTMTAEQVEQLCLAPKMRGCMMDGTDRYGASKLQGKFNNPYASAVRTFKHRNKNNARRATQPADAGESQQEPLLWDSLETLGEFMAEMEDHFSHQCEYADFIIDHDADHGNLPLAHRNALVLQMVQLPVTAELQTLFDFDYVGSCPAFVELINNKIEAAMTPIVYPNGSTAATGRSGHAISPEVLNFARNHAIDAVRLQQEAISSKLCEIMIGLDGLLGTDKKARGLVQRTINATAVLQGNATTPVHATSKRSAKDSSPKYAVQKRVKVESPAIGYSNNGYAGFNQQHEWLLQQPVGQLSNNGPEVMPQHYNNAPFAVPNEASAETPLSGQDEMDWDGMEAQLAGANFDALFNNCPSASTLEPLESDPEWLKQLLEEENGAF